MRTQMASLDFEGPETRGSSSGECPSAKRPAKLAKGISAVRAVWVGASASAEAETMQVLAVRDGLKMFLEVDALSWLVNYLREELSTGGVEPVTGDADPDEGEDDVTRLRWDFHNCAWVAHSGKRDASGRRQRVSKGVRSRRCAGGDLAGVTLEEAKRIVHDELLAELEGSVGVPITA